MPRPQTLAEALEQWLQVKTAGRGLSPHTLRAYRTDIATLAAHLLRVADPGFVDDRRGADYVLVEDLSPDALTKALSSIEQAGAADKSRSRLIGTLRGLIAFLILRGVLAVDPLTATGIERPKAAERLPRYVEGDAEFARVIAAAARPADNARRPWPERDLALAVLLAATGARAAEVCGLRIEDLVLAVDEPYVRVVGKGSVDRDCYLAALAPRPAVWQPSRRNMTTYCCDCTASRPAASSSAISRT